MYDEPPRTFEELMEPFPPETGIKLAGRGRHMRHIKLDAIPEARHDELVALARVPVSRRSEG